jgi:hypothetical protein
MEMRRFLYSRQGRGKKGGKARQKGQGREHKESDEHRRRRHLRARGQAHTEAGTEVRTEPVERLSLEDVIDKYV